jgi:phospholipid/cholesterol/gamma-HCH transport system substrate-binding protein
MARGGGTDPAKRVPRKHRTGADPFKVGAIVLVVGALLVFFGFTKHIPFTHGFRVKAEFASANSIRPNSPVRIAGVTVGKVKDVARDPGTDAALVTMEIDKKGLPIHKDATMKIRPRIFLEGNFFVDLQPGTPSSPTISDGDTIPMSQTATPVQLDQVLTALQADTRHSLQQALEGLGTSLTATPTAAENRDQEALVRGKTGAQALNLAIRYGGPAAKSSAIVNDAFLGQQPHDLSGLIAGLDRVTHGLDQNEAQLEDLVTNFNTTMASFASHSSDLQTSIHLLAPTLQHANSALTHLNASFPNTRAFAREILPGVHETPATIDASFPWIAQTRKLLGPSELGGLTRELSPSTRDLAKVIDTTKTLLPQADLASKCATNVLLPTGDIKIDDGNLSSGEENYKEFWYTMVGLAGEGQNFDGNGSYVRFQPGGGDQTVELGGADLASTPLFGYAIQSSLGTRPAYPGKGQRPPYRPDVPCYTQPVPNLNGALSGPGDNAPGAPVTPSAPATPTTPTTPTTPSLPALSAKPGSTSLTAQLVSRLNPFRKAGP